MLFFSSFLFFHESESVFQLLVFQTFLKAFVNIQKISSCHQKFFIVFEHFGQLSELLWNVRDNFVSWNDGSKS